MAAPTTHIVLAEKVWSKFFGEKDRGKFMVGTSFPDIRYLGVIDRDKTHFEKIELSEIMSCKSFEAGMKFHSLVDRIREKFVTDAGMYDLFIDSPYKTQAMKLFEDKLLAKKIGDRVVTAGYFKTIYDEERQYGIEEIQIIKWHEMLNNYFLSTENNTSVSSFIGAIKVPEGALGEILRVIDNIRSVEKVTKIVSDLYEGFDELLAG